MLNIDIANRAAIRHIEAGRPFLLLVVTCKKTGGRFVSVRSVTPAAFDTGLKACAKDRNFGAYNSPILDSFRRHGSDGHTIVLHSAYKTRKEANLAKKKFVEANAMKAISLNSNRPSKGMPATDFRWLSEDEVREAAKAKRSRAVKKIDSTVVMAE